MLGQYLPHCARSVLAKAQLYRWIYSLEGRTWFVEFGDTFDVQDVSPSSLQHGYAGVVDVLSKAPGCLLNSVSARSEERFQRVVESCGFQETGLHTGNVGRPWEYSEGLHSMTTLDSETVGYDLTGSYLWPGDYFDKKCFCDAFDLDPVHEPCAAPHSTTLDLTRERQWMSATCGDRSLPDNWRKGLKTTEFAYIPLSHWKWPSCVADMPTSITQLPSECSTDACHVDAYGYCRVGRAVERSCFCSNIDYESCGGLCHVFKTRIDYVKWLHRLCHNVPGWHGLPNDWTLLAAPMRSDMTPWNWSLAPGSSEFLGLPSGPAEVEGACPSSAWKLGSLAFINVATFLTVLLCCTTTVQDYLRRYFWDSRNWHWIANGTLGAGLYVFANFFNAVLVRNVGGYQDVPVAQVVLLWCSMPRLTWLAVLLAGAQFLSNFGSALKSLLFAEVVIQVISAAYLVTTVTYGLEHDFYLGRLGTTDAASSARMMYLGALLWLFAVVVMLVVALQTIYASASRSESRAATMPILHGTHNPTTNAMVDNLMDMFNQFWNSLEEKVALYITRPKNRPEREPLLGCKKSHHHGYGALPLVDPSMPVLPGSLVKMYTIAVPGMLVPWIAQWLFWAGFIELSGER